MSWDCTHRSVTRVHTWRAFELRALFFNVSLSSTDKTTFFSRVSVVLPLPLFHGWPERPLPPQVDGGLARLGLLRGALHGLFLLCGHLPLRVLVLNFSVLFASFLFVLRVSLVRGIFLISPSPHSVEEDIILVGAM